MLEVHNRHYEGPFCLHLSPMALKLESGRSLVKRFTLEPESFYTSVPHKVEHCILRGNEHSPAREPHSSLSRKPRHNEVFRLLVERPADCIPSIAYALNFTLLILQIRKGNGSEE